MRFRRLCLSATARERENGERKRVVARGVEEEEENGGRKVMNKTGEEGSKVRHAVCGIVSTFLCRCRAVRRKGCCCRLACEESRA